MSLVSFTLSATHDWPEPTARDQARHLREALVALYPSLARRALQPISGAPLAGWALEINGERAPPAELVVMLPNPALDPVLTVGGLLLVLRVGRPAQWAALFDRVVQGPPAVRVAQAHRSDLVDLHSTDPESVPVPFSTLYPLSWRAWIGQGAEEEARPRGLLRVPGVDWQERPGGRLAAPLPVDFDPQDPLHRALLRASRADLGPWPTASTVARPG